MINLNQDMGLTSSYVKRGRSLFYDNYEVLNNIPEYSNIYLRLIQINEFKVSYKKNKYKNSLDKLKKFISDIENYYRSKNGKTAQDSLFASLVRSLTDNYNTSTKSFNLNKTVSDATSNLKEIHNIISTINNGKINEQKYTELASKIEALPSSTNFIQDRGDLLEEIGAWIANESGLAGIASGRFYARNPKFKDKVKKQIIEDNLVFDKEIKLGNNMRVILTRGKGDLTNADKTGLYDVTGIGSRKNKKNDRFEFVESGYVSYDISGLTGQEFVEEISRLQNANSDLTVQFDDDTYKEIQKIATKIQEKASKSFYLVNESRSKAKVNINDHVILSTLYTLKRTNFYRVMSKGTKKDKFLSNFSTEKPEYASIINYVISKNILKTAYSSNDLYFTREGFEDMASILRDKHYFIAITQDKLNINTIIRKRNYDIQLQHI